MGQVKQKYKFAVIGTDIAIFSIKDNKLQMLLMKMKKEPFLKDWALPGRLIKPEESIDGAAKNKLFETIGIKDGYIEQLSTFGKINRDPFGRVVSVAYLALYKDWRKIKTSDELNWFPVDKLPRLAYDHKEIAERAIHRLQSKLAYSNIICYLLQDEFPLSELQKAYEIILDKKLDKRNFRKKINSLKLVKKIGKKNMSTAYRPAELYKFTNKDYKIIEIL